MRTAGLVVLDLVLIVAVARLLRGVLARAGQPPVMAEVLAGLVLGASVLGALPGDPSGALFTPEARDVLKRLGEVALVAYLFVVGAELDLRSLRREGRAVALVGVGSFAVPWLAGAGLALVVHPSVESDPPLLPFTLFLGTALAVTAFPVLSRIVEGRGLRETSAGRVALAAAAAQEVLVWPLLAVAVALQGGEASPVRILSLGVGALALVLVLARVVVPRVPERVRAASILAGLALSALATELAGLHLVLGALLFGAALTPAARQAGTTLLRARPAVLASALLLPLFFAVPTLGVDVTALGADGLVLLVVVVAVASAAKLASAGVAARLAGLPQSDAITVGALMNARGLVELVVLTVGLEAGLVDARLFAVMVLMALITTFAAGPIAGRRVRRPRPPATGLEEAWAR